MLTQAIEKGLMTDMGGGLEYPLDRSGLPDFKNHDNPLLREFEEKQARSWKVVDEAEPQDLTELNPVFNLGIGFVPKEAHSVVPDILRYSPDYWDPVADGDHFPDFDTNQGMRGQGTSNYVPCDFWDIPNGDDLALHSMSAHHSDDHLGYTRFDDLTPKDRKMSKKQSAEKRPRKGRQKKVDGKAAKKSKKSKNAFPKTASMVVGLDETCIKEALETLQKLKNRPCPLVLSREDAPSTLKDRKLKSEAYDLLDGPILSEVTIPIGKLVISIWLDQLEHNLLLKDFVKKILNMQLADFLDQMRLQEPFVEYHEKETIIRRIHNWTLLTPEMKSSLFERENWTAADFFVMTPAAPLHNAQETNWPNPISTAVSSNYYDLDSIQPSSFYLGAAYETLLENVLSPSYQPPNAENMSYGHTVNGNNLFAEHHSPQRGSNNPLQPPIAMSTSSSMPSKNTVADVVHSCRCSEASNDEHLQQALQIMRRPNPMNTNIKQIILELFKTLGNLGMEKFSSRLLKIPYVAFRFEMKLDMPFECYHNREDIVRVISNFSQLPRCMRNQLLRQSNCISISFQQTQSNKQRLMDNWGSKYQSGLLGPCPTDLPDWTAADFFVMDPAAPLHNAQETGLPGPCLSDRQDWTAADFFVMAPAGPLLDIQETSWPSPVSTVPSNIDDQDGPKPSSFYLGEAHDTLFGDFLSQVSNRTDNIIAFGPSQTLMGTPETSSTPPKHSNHDCPYSETTDDEHLQEARRLMDTRVSKYTKIKKFGSRLQKILGNDEMATFSSQILEIPIEVFQKQMALNTPFKCYNDRQNILQLVTNFSKLPTCMKNQLLRQANPITASCIEASGASLKEVWFAMKRFPKQKRMDTVNEVLSAGSVIYKNSEEMLIKALATTPHE
ncbi:hypothetical protein L5515_017051 [Caenorhabditis briggsae]|uniref:Uncharacterized protein n=1 Tax=Caenorhabditis briggsae TaxID=6238 RepID=A0AAE9FIJ0_CAEBR|nr:hypothetical protein L5515_017051 [Caenorhabditis briggsae]